ncbi:MAG: helix-turn-helix domain-containing protein [Prevotella sp.]|nr:helix-turn-helix domain-containing protein [Prevotella sp.]
MSQIDLCQKIGVAQQNMSAIVRSGNPTVAKLMQIAEGIGCDITDLFYPDPAEEEEERKKALESAKNSKMPLELILRDLTRRAYPGITKEEMDEWMEVIRNKNMGPWFDLNPTQWGEQNAMDKLRQFEEARKKHEGETLNATLWGDIPEGVIERDVNFVQQPAGSEPAYQVHENGLVSENQQQMIQTSTFCPHCGKKVRVGVVLLDS